MRVSRSSFYDWLGGDRTAREQTNELLRDAAVKSHEKSNGAYGRRRIASDLAKQGLCVSVNRVERRMKEAGIEGYRPKSFKITTLGDARRNSPNILKNESISPSGINQVWVSDITYIRTREGWVYLCIFMDLYSRKIVGWKAGNNMKKDLVVGALDSAVRDRRPPTGLIIHSDCGGQYKSKLFRRRLKRHNFRQSMTDGGNCYDNAYAESFFSRLKNEWIRDVKFPDRESAYATLFEFIEVFYNRVRAHSSIGGDSPTEFERKVA